MGADWIHRLRPLLQKFLPQIFLELRPHDRKREFLSRLLAEEGHDPGKGGVLFLSERSTFIADFRAPAPPIDPLSNQREVTSVVGPRSP